MSQPNRKPGAFTLMDMLIIAGVLGMLRGHPAKLWTRSRLRPRMRDMCWLSRSALLSNRRKPPLTFRATAGKCVFEWFAVTVTAAKWENPVKIRQCGGSGRSGRPGPCPHREPRGQERYGGSGPGFIRRVRLLRRFQFRQAMGAGLQILL